MHPDDKISRGMIGAIPTRFRGQCHFCKRELDMRQEGVHQWTAGWVMQREGGGGHGISLPVRENKWAHGDCVAREARGHGKQASFFR